MRRFDLELTVGLFLIAGIVCLGYLSIRLGRMELLGTEGYEVYGLFSNTGGLKSGSAVAIAGVQVGRVKEITLQDYQARVVMSLPTRVKVQEDSIASIKTRGLIGEKYVEITPGASEEILGAGNRIRDTQPPVDIEQVISNYVFGKI
ncbi:MAG: outer membrane lipid asymmetry maintenance protein MlaD [Deltaproteobacteria bacterium HGW-Deltaproteobacteria-15]|jgi:phospholipid/cholesterol/gamma-HCH transport system substrate-binding protein|nr:MAG: outer membrane lipid asymmetry maintenance protein MlaD [Deltaproteobacteria bacterium HGW-Deltaproteobacteria-15]